MTKPLRGTSLQALHIYAWRFFLEIFERPEKTDHGGSTQILRTDKHNGTKTTSPVNSQSQALYT